MKKNLILILFLYNINILWGQSQFNAGFKEYNNENFELAILNFTKSLDKNEKIVDSYLYRGMSYLFLEKTVESKKDLDKAYEIDSTNIKCYVFYGKYYSAINQFGKAIEYYNIALKKNPNDYILYSERAGAESMIGLFKEAIISADYSVKNLPNDYNVYLTRGYVKMRMDKYEDAIEDFNTSLKIQKSHKGYGNRGTAYALLKKYDLAILDFDKALKYNSNDPIILYYKGEVLLALGEKDKACINFLKSKKLGNNAINDIIQNAKCHE